MTRMIDLLLMLFHMFVNIFIILIWTHDILALW